MRHQGNVMGAPLRFTPIGAATSAGHHLGVASGMGGGTRVPINPETHAALVQYHGPGSGGGAGMQGMDATGQEYTEQTAGVTWRRYVAVIFALLLIFVALPIVLLKMLG